MAGGGYPVAYRGTTSAKSTTIGGTALKGPLPDVQHGGPSPFLDYPIGEWDKIQRRRSGGLPKVKRLILPLYKAGKMMKLFNEWDMLIRTVETVQEVVEVVQGTKVAYIVPGGWTLCDTKCQLAPSFSSWGNGGCLPQLTTTGCLGLQAFNNVHGLGEWPTTTILNRVIYCNGDPTASRTTFVRIAFRQASTSLTAPGPVVKINHLYVVEVPKVDWVPNLVPMELPIMAPAADPSPVPYKVIPSRVIDPNADPTEQTHFGYSLDPGANYGVAPVTGIAPGTVPDTPTDPGTVVEVPPDGPPQTKPPTVVAPHRAARPQRGTKEKKLVLAAGPKLGALVNFLTEGADFISAVHKALPPKYRAKRTWHTDPKTGKRYTSAPTIYEKTKAILEHTDKVDWAQAGKNAIANAAEDNFFGRVGNLGKAANKANQTGLRSNYMLGPAL